MLVSSESVTAMVSNLCLLFLDIPAATFLTAYLDVLNNIVGNSECLTECARNPELSLDNLLSKKWELRDQVRKSNKFFSVATFFYYSQANFAILISFGDIMGRNLDSMTGVLVTSNTIAYLITLLVLARKSSRLETHAIELENRVRRRLFWENSSTRCEVDIIPAFNFREEWDCLRVGCFAHNDGNFWRFISFLITSVAVILQFDYKVIRTITSLANILKIPSVENIEWKAQ